MEFQTGKLSQGSMVYALQILFGFSRQFACLKLVRAPARTRSCPRRFTFYVAQPIRFIRGLIL
jgi:hypothetical protein